jgi:hypothetical protein
MAHTREQTPVIILFKKDTEKLRDFDNIDRGRYLAASVNFKIKNTGYSVQRFKFKFIILSNIDGGCSLSQSQKLDLSFGDLLDWFNTLDKTDIIYKGFQEPRYLYKFDEIGGIVNKQY